MKTYQDIIAESKKREELWYRSDAFRDLTVPSSPSAITFKHLQAGGSLPYLRIRDMRAGSPIYTPLLADTEEAKQCFALLLADAAREEAAAAAVAKKEVSRLKNLRSLHTLAKWHGDYADFVSLGQDAFVQELYRDLVLRKEVNGETPLIEEYASLTEPVPASIRKKAEKIAKSDFAGVAVTEPSKEEVSEKVEENPDDIVVMEVEEEEAPAVPEPEPEEVSLEEPEPEVEEPVVPEEKAEPTPKLLGKAPRIEDGIRFYDADSLSGAAVSSYQDAIRKAVLTKTPKAYAITDMESVFAITNTMLSVLQMKETDRALLSDATGALMVITQKTEHARNNSSVLIQLHRIQGNEFSACFDFRMKDSFDEDRNQRVCTGTLLRKDNPSGAEQTERMNFDAAAADAMFLPLTEKIESLTKPREATPSRPGGRIPEQIERE